MDIAGVVWDQKRQTDLDKARPIPDMHIHTRYCNHSTNTIAGVISFLRENSLFGAINEHAPHPEQFKRGNVHIANLEKDVMTPSQMEEFLAVYSASCHDHRLNWTVPVGLEVDLYPGMEDEVHALFHSFQDSFRKHHVPFNHLSLAHHYPGGYSLFRDNFREHIKEQGAEKVIRGYFDALCSEIESYHYDFVCHPGVIHYGFNKLGLFVMADPVLKGAYLKGYSDLLSSAKRSNTALEINTSGMHRNYAEAHPGLGCIPDVLDYPNPHMPVEMMAQGLEQGVKFVVGSDCHDQKNYFGIIQHHQYFDQVHDVLASLGAKEVYVVLNRNLAPVPLERS